MTPLRRLATALVMLAGLVAAASVRADTLSTGNMYHEMWWDEWGMSSNGRMGWNFDMPAFASTPEPTLFVQYAGYPFSGTRYNVLGVWLNGDLLTELTPLMGYPSDPQSVTLALADGLHVGANRLEVGMKSGPFDWVFHEATITFTPAVPEPGTAGLAGLGVAALAIASRRRRLAAAATR